MKASKGPRAVQTEPSRESVELDIHEVVHDTVDVFAVTAHQKGVEVYCLVSPRIAWTVIGDLGRFRRVLGRLVGDAVERASRGEVVIRVELEAEADEEVVLRIAVRLPTRARPEHCDAGRGLRACEPLVEAMGGTIGVEHTPFFTVRLRIGPTPREIPSLDGVRVLTLTRSATQRAQLVTTLAHAGARVDAFDRPVPAFDALLEAARSGRPYESAVLDLEAEEMTTGLDVAEWMTDEPSCDPTRCVLLASLADSAAPEDVARIDALVSKPVRARELLEALGRPERTRPAGELSAAFVRPDVLAAISEAGEGWVLR